jgi:MFS family permease
MSDLGRSGSAVAVVAMPPAGIHPAAKSTALKRAVVVLVCVGMFMTTLDASIVNIGLPSIAHAFSTPLSGTIEWVIIGYLVVIAALPLTFGRLSDVVGRTPIWTAGLAVFTLGSAVCGAAPSLGVLIAARALQGVGAALILATSTAILTDAIAATRRILPRTPGYGPGRFDRAGALLSWSSPCWPCSPSASSCRSTSRSYAVSRPRAPGGS